MTWSSDAAVTVVIAAEGYPDRPRAGDPVEGCEDVPAADGQPVVVPLQDADPRRVGGSVTAHCDREVPEIDDEEPARADARCFSGEPVALPAPARVVRDEAQPDVVAALADAGFEDQLLLSHDVCLTSDLAAYGGPGYAYLLTGFRERMDEAGLPGSLWRRLLVDNPRRALTGGP